jgi:hypothetical protein
LLQKFVATGMLRMTFAFGYEPRLYNKFLLQQKHKQVKLTWVYFWVIVCERQGRSFLHSRSGKSTMKTPDAVKQNIGERKAAEVAS